MATVIKHLVLASYLVLIIGPCANAASDSRIVPSIRPAVPSVRQAWVAQETERWIESYDGTPSVALVEKKKDELTSLKSGTEVYEIPGIFVHDGASVYALDNATVVETQNGYDVYRNGAPFRRFSKDVKLFASLRYSFITLRQAKCDRNFFPIVA